MKFSRQTPSPKYSRNKSGFTLIEMIVATFLLGIGVFGAMGAFSAATNASSSAEQFHQAALLAQMRMTELELHPETLGGGGDTQGDFGEGGTGFRYLQHIESADFPNLFLVTLRIQWGDPDHPRERVFVTYLRNDQNTGDSSTTSGSSGGTNSQNGGSSNAPNSR